ncbi:DUF3885 domain-containing protein [Bacillus infantis]|uniref:DUF3885 domain-containing protein n=1 Tax=Bacillus infantis TaxID=324767 RepID=UPI003CFA99D8
MEVKAYLERTFPNLILKPSLYCQWDIGIHFELGNGIYQVKEDGELNLHRFEAVYSQTWSLFMSLFSEEDEMGVALNIYHTETGRKSKRATKVFGHYLRNKKLKYQIVHETLQHLPDDEEAGHTSRFYLKGRKSDFDCLKIITAACNEDFPLKPRFGNDGGSYYPDIFFINMTQDIIFFIYDDRGCEVIAARTDSLRQLYAEYSEWVDEYNM